MQVKRVWSLLSALVASAAVGLSAGQPSGGMPAEESMKQFKIADGLEISLWASEPNVVNPTNMDIDERGRIWIAEGANYRGQHRLRPEGDRIVICEDTDLDGKADSFKTFYQGPDLLCPLGIGVIGNKVYVSQSPNLLVFTMDASGDKPAGPPEILFTGFSGWNHDHGLHALLFGPDGRFYFNSGNSGLTGENYGQPKPPAEANAQIRNAKGDLLVDTTGSNPFPKGKIWRGKDKQPGQGYLEGMAFRCNPDGSGFETLGHNFRNNYEVTVDSFGTVWQSDNDDDGNQGVRLNYVMEGGNFGYKGPGSWAQDTMRYPTQSQQDAHWHQRQPGVVPNLYNTGGGSPTGIMVYEGELFGPDARGALVHCNAGGQWYSYVGLFKTTPAGAGYKTELKELVKSDDKWMKPADICTGPDGAIYIADWYDAQSGGHGMKDNAAGAQQGRIYRLAPKGFKPSKPVLDLASVKGQIAALCSPNLATRYVGYSKLLEGGDAAEAELKALYETSQNPYHRARALWLLARGKNGASHVAAALKDKDANIRVTAIRAARLIKQDIPALAAQMAGDESHAVVRELALAMNYEPNEKALDVLVKLIDRIDTQEPEAPVYDPKVRGKKMEQLAEEEKERQERVKNRWLLEAIGIAAQGREKELLEAWKAKGARKDDAALVTKLTWRLNKEIAQLPPKPEAGKDGKK